MAVLSDPVRQRFPDLDRLADEVRVRLAAGGGVLLGESGALSTCVHVLSDAAPGVVRVLTHADAGQVFYRRPRRQEVLHLDVFHAEGEVDHHLVAACLRQALAAAGAGVYADFVDVQTATGGGRITGSLRYGQRETLRRAHRNHVHVAMLLPWRHLSAVFHVLAAVEEAVARTGLHLRRVEGLVRDEGTGGERLPLEDYAAVTDSRIPEAGDGEDPGDPHGPDRAGEPTGGRGAGRSLGRREQERLHLAAVDLSTRVESVQLALELLRGLDQGRPRRQAVQQLVAAGADGEEAERLLDDLLRAGYLIQEGMDLRLTGPGRALLRYLEEHPRDVRLALRSAMQRLTRRRVWQGGRVPVPGARLQPQGSGRTRTVRPPEPGSRLGEVAWPETVLAAAARGRLPVRVTPEDLRLQRRRRRKPVDVLLLIDASASMAGERMRAAKALARHLLFTTRDRVAVVVFQERHVRISVPFTRNYARVEEGLATIRPFGLTPLATGLVQARAYLQRARVRNPLLLLVTDGIPTVPHLGKNPLEDALRAAAEWRGSRAGFACVGLQPNERYLADLVRAAGGALYVVEELQAGTLVAIADRERRRRQGRLRSEGA